MRDSRTPPVPSRARCAGSAPEILLGLFFLLGGSLGFGCEVAANVLGESAPETAAWLMRVSKPAMRVPYASATPAGGSPP